MEQPDRPVKIKWPPKLQPRLLRELYASSAAGMLDEALLDEVGIDTLIHSFHIDAKSGLPNRASGNNLIEGSLRDVVRFLDGLSGVQPENDLRFHDTADLMWRRRTGRL